MNGPLVASQQPVFCSLTDRADLRQHWDGLMRQDGPVRAAADRRASQHSARDHRQFYKYL